MFIIKEDTPQDQVGQGTPEDVQKSIINWLSTNGYTVRTTDEDANFIKSQVQPEVDKAYKGFTEQVETMVSELTGLQKNNNEKATEYLKRAVDEKLQTATALETELKELKEKGVQGNQVAEEYKRQLETLQAKFAEAQTEHENAVNDLKNQMFTGKVDGMINGVMSEIKPKLRSDIDENLVGDIIAARLSKFRSENQAKEFDGMVVFADTNGEMRTSKKDGKPMSAAEILQSYFDDIIDKSRTQGGAGSGQGQGGQGGQGGKTEIPETVKSQVGLHNYLTNDLKLSPSSKEFAEIYNEHAETLPLRENSLTS